MDSTIFHGIIYSTLAPDPNKDITLLPAVRARLNRMPQTIDEAKAWITDAVICINKQFPIEFGNTPSDTAKRFFSEPFTEIHQDEIEMTLDFGQYGNSKLERLYGALIKWECYRVKNTLLEYVSQIQDDSLSRKEVHLTMTFIRKEAYDLCETLYGGNRPVIIPTGNNGEVYRQKVHEIDSVNNYLIRSLAWLYYDISMTFSQILNDEDIVEPEDFCEYISCAFIQDFAFTEKIHALQIAHKAQSSESVVLLKDLYRYRRIGLPSVNLVIDSLENKLYQTIADTDIVFSETSIEKEYRSRFHKSDDPRAIMGIIEDDIAEINELEISPESSSSIPAKVRSYLYSVKPIYEKAIGQILTTAIVKSKGSGKAKPVKATQTLPDRKKITQSQLRFMSGSYFGQQIMSEDDYNYMMSIVLEYIKKGEIPSIKNKIYTNFPATHIRYTFYLIYSQMKKSPCSREGWVHLISILFSKFDGTSEETTSKKFSEKPKSYDSDIASQE